MEDSTAWWVCFVQFVARVESLILSYYPNKEIEFKPSSTSVGEHVSCRISWNPWFLIFPHTKESDWCLPGLLERWNMTRSEWYRYIYIYIHISVCVLLTYCVPLLLFLHRLEIQVFSKISPYLWKTSALLFLRACFQPGQEHILSVIREVVRTCSWPLKMWGLPQIIQTR